MHVKSTPYIVLLSKSRFNKWPSGRNTITQAIQHTEL